MWNLVAAVIVGFNHYWEAAIVSEWPRTHDTIIDFIRRKRLGIPHVWEDMQ